jgi:hypothetical protein
MPLGETLLVPGSQGVEVAQLHRELAALGLEVPAEERDALRYGEGTVRLVRLLQRERKLRQTGNLDPETARDITGRLTSVERVSGLLSSPATPAVGGLTVVVVDRRVGGDRQLGKGVTDHAGRFDVPLEDRRLEGKGGLDLQVLVLGAGGAVLGRSEVRTAAASGADLDVRLPAGAEVRTSEYAALEAAIRTTYKGPLADLTETAERPDISLLGATTGWDARAIALAKLAGGLAAGAKGLDAELFYALLRAGLPADPAALARIATSSVVAIWQRAAGGGVVRGLSRQRLQDATAAFERFRAGHAGELRAQAAGTDLDGLLALRVKRVAARRELAEVVASAQPEDVWDAIACWARGQDLSDAARERLVDGLRLDAGLARLTLGNVDVVRRLRAEVRDLREPADLAARGFHRADRWRGLVEPDSVPDTLPGNTPRQRADAYAELLAATVSVSWPTAVVAARLLDRDDPLTLPGADDRVQGEVAVFLADPDRGFELGSQPFRQYALDRDVALSDEARAGVELLQRLYQITPDDTALTALATAGLDSARAIAVQPRARFLARYGRALGGAEQALRVHERASEVHTAVISLALGYATAASAPSLGGGNLLAPLTAGGGDSPVAARATLETLFGSLDACECEHCRSMLGPAAYLVDLLSFLDQPDLARNPLDELLRRRPDIAHLPLSCDNTNKALPLVDIVNEILGHLAGADDLELAQFTGYDTPAGVAGEEQRASPQHDDVQVALDADAALAAASFPPPLPYSRNLDQLRSVLGALDVELAGALVALRAHDDVDRGAAPYGWHDIRLEQAGLDRATHRLFTNAGVGLAEHYGYPAGTAAGTIRNQLSRVQAFVRRARLDYDDVIALLHTRYANPAVDLVGKLEGLGVPFETLRALRAGAIDAAAFRDALAEGFDEGPYGDDVVAWVVDDDRWARIAGLITLSNPNDPQALCKLDELEFRQLGDQAPAALLTGAFVRLARLVRLWRALDWPLSDVDAALWALLPAAARPDGTDDPATAAAHGQGWDTALLGLGAVVEALDRLGLRRDRELRSLLTLWAPMDTTGGGSLYHRLFLQRPGVAAAFARGPDGGVLAGDAALGDHAEAVRGALRIDGGEWAQLLAALGAGDATPLTLELVSALYRRAWLARVLKLSVTELLALLECTGLDPFSPPVQARPDLLTLVDLVARLRASKLGAAKALYLVWDRDLRGQADQGTAANRTFAARLRAELTAAAGELGGDGEIDDDKALALLATVHGPSTAEFFHALLTPTFTATAAYAGGDPELPAGVLAAAGGALAYDDVHKLLRHQGVVTADRRDALRAAGDAANLGQAFRDAVDALRDDSDARTEPFLERHPDLRAALATYLAGAGTQAERRAALFEELAGPLLEARVRQQAVASLAAAVGTGSEFAAALLDDAGALPANRIPPAPAEAPPAISDLLALRHGGLTARFWLGAVAGDADSEREAVAVDHSAGGPGALPGGGNPVNGRWSGALASAVDGPHELIVEADAGAQVGVLLDGEAVALGQEAPGRWVSAAAVELRAASPVPVELAVDGAADHVRLSWRADGTARSGRVPVPASNLFGERALADLQATTTRFRKAASIAQTLGIPSAAMCWLARRPERRVDGRAWLHAVGVTGDSPARLELLGVLEDLLAFARLCERFPGEATGLLAHLAEPDAVDGGVPRLDRAMAWTPAHTDAFLGHVGGGRADLADLALLERLVAAMDLSARVGVPAPVLLASVTNDPSHGQARGLLDALRARYDDRAWRDLVQPINDDLRRRRRDALVAYTLNRFAAAGGELAEVDTPERLYERLLIDVQMDPCMPTSRVLHAILATQQFVDRILLSLEDGIPPSAIDAEQWAWMSRYRVWEVQRKLLLYPENWLEPELRDDQTHLFSSAMGELLQGDITDDRAAQALGGYLTGLERIARLEPVGVFDETETGGPEVVHVVARTPGRDRTWYYRRLADGSWSPWVPIDADIEGDPVLPVVWRGRLFVFWLRVTKETAVDGSAGGVNTSSSTKLADVERGQLGSEAKSRSGQQREAVSASLAFSEYVDGAWTPAVGADPDDGILIGTFPVTGSTRFRREELVWQTRLDTDGSLRVGIVGEKGWRLFNTYSSPAVQTFTTGKAQPFARRFNLTTSLEVTYFAKQPAPPGGESPYDSFVRAVVAGDYVWRVVQPGNSHVRPWTSPFLAADRRHAFYVTSRSSPPKAGGFGFGGFVAVAVDHLELPPLYHEPMPTRVPVAELLTGAGGLRVVIGTTTPVVVDGVAISARGAVSLELER